MRKLLPVVAALAATTPVFAQNCNGAPPPATIASSPNYPTATHYLGGTGLDSRNLFWDVTLTGSVDITQIGLQLYDYTGSPNPNQVGQTAVINVYTVAGGHNATNRLASTGWTLAGTGSVLVAAYPTESVVTLNAPITMTAGFYGVCFEIMPVTGGPNPDRLHPLVTLPGPSPTISDSFFSITNQYYQGVGWLAVTAGTSGGAATANNNVNVYYTPAASSALWTQFGEGCYFRSRSFFETFAAPNTAPDLENTVFTMTPSTGVAGPNYLVFPAGTPYAAPTGTTRNSVPSAAVPTGYTAGTWDDAMDTPVTLPFTFPFLSSSTNVVTATSNGSLFLANVTDGSRAYGYYGAIGDFKDFEPRISAFWSDLDMEPVSPTTGAGGGLFYDTDNISYARFTWHNVAEWTTGNNGPLNSFSITLFSSGNIEVAYGDLNIAAAQAIVGFSEGLGNRLPNAQDLSATMPFSSGDGAIPPVLGMDARPVIGTTPNIVTTNVTAGTIFEFFIASLGGVSPGAPLAVFGMPDCFLHMNQGLIVSAFLQPINPSTNQFEVPFSIPNDPSFQNVQFFFQAAPLTSGLNPANLLSSNGICAKLGT